MQIESDAECKGAQIRCSLIYQRISQQKLHKGRHAACLSCILASAVLSQPMSLNLVWSCRGDDRPSRTADERSFAVAYPDGYEGYWNACNIVGDYSANKLNVDDVGFLTAMVDKLISEIGVDPGRVFATGISRGGHMAFRLALAFSATQVRDISTCNTWSSRLPGNRWTLIWTKLFSGLRSQDSGVVWCLHRIHPDDWQPRQPD